MGKAFGIHQVARLFKDRSRQHYEVTLLEREIEVSEPIHRIHQVSFLSRMLPNANDAHPQCSRKLRERSPDGTESNDHYGRVFQLTGTRHGFADLLLRPVP